MTDVNERRWTVWVCDRHGRVSCNECGAEDRGELVPVIPAESDTPPRDPEAELEGSRWTVGEPGTFVKGPVVNKPTVLVEASLLAAAEKDRDEAQERADDFHTAAKLAGEARDNWRRSHDDLQQRLARRTEALEEILDLAVNYGYGDVASPGQQTVENPIREIARDALSEGRE